MADRLRKHGATLLQLLGLLILAIAAFLIHPIVGLVVTGVFVTGFGYLMEKPIYVPKLEDKRNG